MTTYLADYAHFTNKDDMDKAAKEHIAAHWNAMNDTERAVLDMIRRYSVKFGAAHLKHETMEKALEKSNATIRRAIRKLEKLGIIERIHFVRPIMSGLGANIYAINPFSEQGEMNSGVMPTNLTTARISQRNRKTNRYFLNLLLLKILKQRLLRNSSRQHSTGE